MKKWMFFVFVSAVNFLSAQNFTRKDSLRGGLPFERTCFDVQHYGLNLKIDIDKKYIQGFNEIEFKINNQTKKIQLDLFANMKIDSIVFNQKKLNYKREFDAVFIDFEEELMPETNQKLKFYYSGNPTIAKNPPWDGGFVFSTDAAGKPWVGVACQGAGASLWFPCKDSQTDEPNFGATLKIEVPNGLMNVSNGRLMRTTDMKNGFTRWDWEVKNPINSYNITINIADYAHFGENYKGLDLDYYVLKENLEKAKIQFEQVKPMMDCYQEKFGEYPFKNDGFKLVETHYLGMEHQSAVAYGNHYLKGYLGNDFSDTGAGLQFDYIIIHESGHEWFGNSITSKDIADMWIHEGFTCYTESVFLECQFGKQVAENYINGLKSKVENKYPIIGKYGVANESPTTDMYFKGSLFINTLRNILNDDNKWWAFLKEYSLKFRHQIIENKDVILFFSQKFQMNLLPVFSQYLNYAKPPVLEIKKLKNSIQLRFKTDVLGFEMPLYLEKNKKVTLSNNWVALKKSVSLNKTIKEITSKYYIQISY
jgi:aminopeptidase N